MSRKGSNYFERSWEIISVSDRVGTLKPWNSILTGRIIAQGVIPLARRVGAGVEEIVDRSASGNIRSIEPNLVFDSIKHGMVFVELTLSA